MSDKPEVATASELEGPSAAQLLDQIKEKQRELNASKADKPAIDAPEPVASTEPETPVVDLGADNSNKPAEPASESNVGGVPGPAGKDKPEWERWIEKKGLRKSDGSVDLDKLVRNNRELERELWRKNTGRGAEAPVQAQPEQVPMRPAYVPPSAPNIEELAKRYNLDPSDFERVAPLAADIAANQVAARMAPMAAELNQMRREFARNSELQSLREDPAYSDPRVQFEMHQILETNPSILQNEPAPFRYALNEALRNMGRRILEGSIEPGVTNPPVSGSPRLPVTPPRTAGSGGSATASGGIQPSGRISQRDFDRLPAAEQRKILAKMGFVSEES